MHTLEERRQWLGVLCCSKPDELARLLDSYEAAPTVLRAPEVGLALVTGRTGSSGSPFGLGEMTLTRCVLQVDDAVGVGYVRGRSPQHAYRVALADALLQGDQHGSVVENVIVPLQRSERNQREQRTKDVEESRVQFVTLVRGD